MSLASSLMFHSSAVGSEVDLNDNLAPSLVSVRISKSALVEGEIALVTLVIRDDKNELLTWPLVGFRPPPDSPGRISNESFAMGGRGLISTTRTSEYVEQTFEFELKAPAWPGTYLAWTIQSVIDKNRNESTFDINTCENKNINSSRRPVGFPSIVPICSVSFSVRLLTEAEKSEAKAKAEADAKAKAEAEGKAKAEAEAKAKAEAEAKAKAEAEAKAKAKAEADAKAKAEAEARAKAQAEVDLACKSSKQEADRLKTQVLNSVANYPKASKSLVELLTDDTFFIGCPNTASVNILSLKFKTLIANLDSNKSTITCFKGKITKKVTAVNPKCPAGYKKK